MTNKASQQAKIHGRKGEEAAKKYLLSRGYRVLFANFHSKFGEIDIIAEKNQAIIFVEVKTRTDNFNFGIPEEAMNFSKLQKIKLTIYEFFVKNPDYKYKTWSINLITVVLNSFEQVKKIVHYKSVEIY